MCAQLVNSQLRHKPNGKVETLDNDVTMSVQSGQNDNKDNMDNSVDMKNEKSQSKSNFKVKSDYDQTYSRVSNF